MPQTISYANIKHHRFLEGKAILEKKISQKISTLLNSKTRRFICRKVQLLCFHNEYEQKFIF